MSRSTSISIPDLRKKLDFLKERLAIKTDSELADALKRSRKTLADYIGGYGTGRPEHVPEEIVKDLVRLTATALENGVGESRLRFLWEQPYPAFLNALRPETEKTLRELLEQTPRLGLLDGFIVPNEPSRGMMEFDDLVKDPALRRAKFGDSIYFECRPLSSCFIVLVVETDAGFQLCAPRGGVPIRSGSQRVRIPAGKNLVFGGPAGLHRFYALYIDSVVPPRITTMQAPLSVLLHEECSQLAYELAGASTTRGWSLDCWNVFVEPSSE